jgi:rhodanese-related sulfurtransferase
MTPTEPEVPEVDVDEARRLVDEDGALLLDVRTESEWNDGHAEGAVWIPITEIETRREELPGDRLIVAICGSGPRSARVTAALLAWGYDAVNVSGGSKAWQAAGHPVVGTIA